MSRDRIGYGLRLGLAALIALALALALGLPNPYWAAMTVWITAQPTRGMLAERLAFRLLGTVAGAAVGLLLLRATHEPVLVVAALALWLGLCIAAGNLLRHSLAYGTLLAGYTAGIVVLPEFIPGLPPHDLPAARILATILGILVSAIVTWLLTPDSPREATLRRMSELGRDGLAWAADCLRGTLPAPGLAAREQALLVELARIEDGADQLAAGSPRAYARIRALRGVVAALLSVISTARLLQARLAELPPDPGLAAWCEDLACRLGTAAPPAAGAPPPAARRTAAALAEAVVALRQALAALDSAPAAPPRRMPFHRDWPAALAAALRGVAAVGLLGAAWLLSGWSFGPFLVMGGSIFASAFSGHPQPVAALRGVLMGACAGLAAALLCRLVLLPQEAGMGQLLLTLAPFMALGGLAQAHPVLGKPAMDANMVFMLAAQPMLPLHGTPAMLVQGGLAIPLSIAATLSIFWLLRGDRLRGLPVALRRDLAGLAAGRDAAALARGRARLDHRVLRLTQQAPDRAAEGLAVLRLGDALRLLGGAGCAAAAVLRQPAAAWDGVPAALRGGAGADEAGSLMRSAATALEAAVPVLRPVAPALRRLPGSAAAPAEPAPRP